LFLLLCGCGGIFLNGVLKWIAIVLAVFTFLLMLTRYNRWNGAGWRKVHGRAMLAYASLAGEEMALSRQEGRQFNPENPCRKLAYRLVGYGKQNEADAMVNALVLEQGQYFSHLISLYGHEVEPRLSEQQLMKLQEVTDQFEIGPQLVIGNVIENTFGGEEATKYVMAILKKEVS
jgi:hypothetical protein